MWGFSRVSGYAPLSTDTLYRTIQLFNVEWQTPPTGTPWQLELARLLAPLVVASAVLAAVLVFARDQVQWLRTRWFRDHVVVVGTGHGAANFARATKRELCRPVVGIGLSDSTEDVRDLRASGVPVLVGDARLSQTLISARVHRASAVLIWTGDDSTNLSILATLREVMDTRAPSDATIPIKVVIDSLPVWLQLSRMPSTRTEDCVRVEYLNFQDLAAQVLLKSFGKAAREQGSVSFDGSGALVLRGDGPTLARLTVQLLRLPQVPKRTKCVAGVEVVLQGRAEEAMRLLSRTEPWAAEEARMSVDGPTPDDARAAFVCGYSIADSLGASLDIDRRVGPANRRFKVFAAVADEEDQCALASTDLPRDRIDLPSLYEELKPERLLDREAFDRLPKAMFAAERHNEFWATARKHGSVSEGRVEEEAQKQLEDGEASSYTSVLDDFRERGASLRPMVAQAHGTLAVSDEDIDDVARREFTRLPELVHEGRRDRAWEELEEDERARYRAWVRELPRLLATVGYELAWDGASYFPRKNTRA